MAIGTRQQLFSTQTSSPYYKQFTHIKQIIVYIGNNNKSLIAKVTDFI